MVSIPETVSVDMDFCPPLSLDAAPGCVAEVLASLLQVSQTGTGKQVEELVHHKKACTITAGDGHGHINVALSWV